MSDIIDMLERDNPEIILNSGCDIICEACPNNIGGECKDCIKVERIDYNCLSELKLFNGSIINWSDLKRLANKSIIEKNKLDKVCGSCMWKQYCK